MRVREIHGPDRNAVWSLLEPVIRSGETYAFARDMSESEALAYWLGAGAEAFVCEADGVVVGCSRLAANQRGGGAHVANAAFVTRADYTGRGVARLLAEHAIARAAERGFTAMQFNFVVSTNERAIRLWRSLGFEIVGRLPGAFDHPAFGKVDAFVMFRELALASPADRA